MANIVAIVGRPNVGKSTLFNRLLQRREAIVDSVSGVTRDRHYGKSDWNGKEFTVIDTGGYIEGSDDIFEGEIRKQVELAIDEASVIIFVVDNQIGVTDMDKRVALLLQQKTDKPVFLAVNKVDSNKNILDAVEFYELGFEKYYTISATSGGGTGDLLDDVINALPEEKHEDPFEGLPKITIVGRPNVGKSTLFNRLVRKRIAITQDDPGVTRDRLYQEAEWQNRYFTLVDTGGLEPKNKELFSKIIIK